LYTLWPVYRPARQLLHIGWTSAAGARPQHTCYAQDLRRVLCDLRALCVIPGSLPWRYSPNACSQMFCATTTLLFLALVRLLQVLGCLCSGIDLNLAHCVYCAKDRYDGYITDPPKDTSFDGPLPALRPWRKNELVACSTCPAAFHRSCYMEHTGDEVRSPTMPKVTSLRSASCDGHSGSTRLNLCVVPL
jgi:hypothetical protein